MKHHITRALVALLAAAALTAIAASGLVGGRPALRKRQTDPFFAPV